jgi:hypothetical protein
VNQKIFIFGGIGSTVSVQNECLQDIVVLDIDSWAWSTPVVKGTLPEPRFVHRMAAFSSKLLLFGGRTSGLEKFNDVHWFDTETMTWTKEDSVIGAPPSSRGGCSLVAIGTQVCHVNALSPGACLTTRASRAGLEQVLHPDDTCGIAVRERGYVWRKAGRQAWSDSARQAGCCAPGQLTKACAGHGVLRKGRARRLPIRRRARARPCQPAGPLRQPKGRMATARKVRGGCW